MTAGNVGDAVPAEAQLADLLSAEAQAGEDASAAATSPAGPAGSAEPAQGEEEASVAGGAKEVAPRPEVFGDASYGTADVVERLEAAGIEVYTKVQPACGRKGKHSQDALCGESTTAPPAPRWSAGSATS